MNVTDLLKREEGFRPTPYLCSQGKQTIGYGRNLEDRGITEPEAAWLLERDIEGCVAKLRDEAYWLDLNEVRQAVLISMVFQMGWVGFQGFKNTRACIAAKRYYEAANHMLNSKWATQTRARANRLARMMETGEWSA